MAQTNGALEPQGPALRRTLVVGFFELSKRELRTPEGVVPPTPNAVSAIIDEEIAAGRMRYDPQTHDLAVVDENARATINTRLLPILSALEHVRVSRAIAQHLRSAGSEFARVVANSPAVFDARNGSLMFLSHDDGLMTAARLERARRATTITDPNLRYCLGDLAAAGGAFERDDHGSLCCVMARREQVGDALATLYEASRPSAERFNRLQSLLYSPDISEKLGLGRDATAEQLQAFTAGLTRWDLERIEQQLGPALYATYRDGLTTSASGRAQSATAGRTADQYFSQPHERARSERPFEIGPNPEDAAGRARRLAREREAGNGQAGLHALHEDRAKLEQLIERQQGTPAEAIISERPLTRERPNRDEPGLIIAGSLIKLTRFHGLMHADDGSYHIFEIDALARSKIGERANWRDGAPVRPALLAIANKAARVWLRRSDDGGLSFEAERPQTIQARRERVAQERNETSLEYEAGQRLKLDLALCMSHATELYAHAHDLAPEAVAPMDLADRAEAIAYRGTIGWVGSCYFVQICKAGTHFIVVPHELAAFDRTPEIGAAWTISYPEGEEFARGQCAVARTCDTKLRELARDAVPALDGEQALRHEQRLYALAAMTTGAQRGIPREELPLIDLPALTESRYLVGAVVQASPDMSFAHIEGSGLLGLDHGRLARRFDVGDTMGVHWDSKNSRSRWASTNMSSWLLSANATSVLRVTKSNAAN